MKRGLKLGFGIPLVLLGLFMTIGGIALVVLVGTDGSFTLPQTRGLSSGHALVLETLDLSEALPSSGSFAATVGVKVQGDNGHGDVFVGIGPAPDVARYLDRVQVDRITQVNWPGGMRTETEPGTRRPKPPGEQSFWVAMAQGSPATLTWPVAPCIMSNAPSTRHACASSSAISRSLYALYGLISAPPSYLPLSHSSGAEYDTSEPHALCCRRLPVHMSRATPLAPGGCPG